MAGCLNVWTYAWTNGWVNSYRGGMDACMRERMRGCMGGWMNGWQGITKEEGRKQEASKRARRGGEKLIHLVSESLAPPQHKPVPLFGLTWLSQSHAVNPLRRDKKRI